MSTDTAGPTTTASATSSAAGDGSATITASGTALASPSPSFGWGSATGLAGVLAAWGTAAAAAFAAGLDSTPFYADNGVVTLLIAAVVATLGFLGARSSQANTIVRSGADVTAGVLVQLDSYRAQIDAGLAELRAQRPPAAGTTTGPSGPVVAYVPVEPWPSGDGDDLPEPDDVDRTVAA